MANAARERVDAVFPPPLRCSTDGRSIMSTVGAVKNATHVLHSETVGGKPFGAEAVRKNLGKATLPSIESAMDFVAVVEASQ